MSKPLQHVAYITVRSDGEQIYLRLTPQGDEATGGDILEALRNLTDAIELKVDTLKFATEG